MTTSVFDLYQKTYLALAFERAELFKVIALEFRPRAVLYPGCFVHVTPSFYFPQVVYVDRNTQAAQFFARQKAVTGLIQRRKTYRQSAWYRFLAQDFTQPLPLPESSFDLLLALFAIDDPLPCARYLKPGGLFLTNRPPAAMTSQFSLLTTIYARHGKYHLAASDSRAAHPPQPATLKSIRQGNRGLEYVEQEVYSLFKKNPGK